MRNWPCARLSSAASPTAWGEIDYRAYLGELSRMPVETPLMLEHLKTAEEYEEGKRYILRTGGAGSFLGGAINRRTTALVDMPSLHRRHRLLSVVPPVRHRHRQVTRNGETT